MSGYKEQGNDDIRGNSGLAVALAEYDSAQIVAAATPCGFPGCTGKSHDPLTPEADWGHEIPLQRFENGEVEIALSGTMNQPPTGSVWLSGDYVNLSPEQLRHLADAYAELPALMRDKADELDALRTQMVVNRIQSAHSPTAGDAYAACVELGAPIVETFVRILNEEGNR